MTAVCGLRGSARHGRDKARCRAGVRTGDHEWLALLSTDACRWWPSPVAEPYLPPEHPPILQRPRHCQRSSRVRQSGAGRATTFFRSFAPTAGGRQERSHGNRPKSVQVPQKRKPGVGDAGLCRRGSGSRGTRRSTTAAAHRRAGRRAARHRWPDHTPERPRAAPRCTGCRCTSCPAGPA